MTCALRSGGSDCSADGSDGLGELREEQFFFGEVKEVGGSMWWFKRLVWMGLVMITSII